VSGHLLAVGDLQEKVRGQPRRLAEPAQAVRCLPLQDQPTVHEKIEARTGVSV
jgi:hypothetical protein